jgi:hypothetical protein
VTEYDVEPRTKKGNKNGKWWVVICNGHIANDHWHTTERSAQKHCENINTFERAWNKR